MSSGIITIDHLTKDYGKGRGIFDIDFSIPEGAVYGYVGTNGSGKTTTIRNIMGFIRPASGHALVKGYDAWKYQAELKNHISYIPGEIEFPRFPTGTAFLDYQAKYLTKRDDRYRDQLIERLRLDPTADLRRMSKGMKQKTAIVAALMGDKEILIMDEPTTGLDPLMREEFLAMVREEKDRGKTIFMSTHIYEEVEAVCDKVAIIHKGHIVSELDLHDMEHQRRKKFILSFGSERDKEEFRDMWHERSEIEGKSLITHADKEELQDFFSILKRFDVTGLREEHLSLEEYFKSIYRGGTDSE